MNEPWGLSGPQFLLVYFPALAAAMIAVVVTRSRARSADPSLVPARTAPDLTLYELAFFLRGRDGVTEAAIAELLHTDALRTNPKGFLRPTGKSAPDPIAAQTLSAVGSGKQVKRARTSAPMPTIAPMIDKLVGQGLLVSPARLRTVRAVAWLPGVVVLIGAARLINGVALHRPVGFLILGLILGLFLQVIARGLVVQPMRTVDGAKLAHRFRTRTQPALSDWARTCPAGVRTAATANVAVLGLVAYPDPTISSVMRVSGGSSAGSFDGGSSGSGGDSGGGGGCGGGCGG